MATWHNRLYVSVLCVHVFSSIPQRSSLSWLREASATHLDATQKKERETEKKFSLDRLPRKLNGVRRQNDCILSFGSQDSRTVNSVPNDSTGQNEIAIFALNNLYAAILDGHALRRNHWLFVCSRRTESTET